MTVNDLRVLIADLDGTMEVVVPGGDHQYFPPVVGVTPIWDNGPKYRPTRDRFHEPASDEVSNSDALVVGRG